MHMCSCAMRYGCMQMQQLMCDMSIYTPRCCRLCARCGCTAYMGGPASAVGPAVCLTSPGCLGGASRGEITSCTSNMTCGMRLHVSMGAHDSVAFCITYVGERSHRTVGDRGSENVLLCSLITECLGWYTCTYTWDCSFVCCMNYTSAAYPRDVKINRLQIWVVV